MNEIEKLEQGIAALESQRQLLSDAVVDALLVPLRERLASLRASAAIPSADQRKQITVLFADVSRFTSISEKMDAEDLLNTMNLLWEQIDNAIIAHHGQVDKHIGDSVMALWGVKESREDDAEQAILAALAMQAFLPAFKKAHRLPIRMRIGLNTGPVLLGEIGSNSEFTAIGDTVNLASRLEHAAPVGGILISQATYSQVRGLFDVHSRPLLKVKGKSEPLQTYAVQRAKPRAFYMRTRGVEGIETHLIGRDAELAQLQNAFNACVAQPAAVQALTIVAEAGIGKSRLLQEFLAWAELSPVTYRLFMGRATPSSAAAPYALIRSLFAFRFEIQESDSLEAARAKLEQGFSKLNPADPHAQEKAHFIGHLLGWDFSASPHVRGLLTDPLQIRTLALNFMTQFFSAITQASPVVILLDDLHWADQASLDMLRHVIGNLPPATALLLVGNTRPTLFERYPSWKLVAQKRIDLKPLAAGDSARLVNDILRYVADLPVELRDLVVRQADGNPFYMEELIKMLIDEQVIQPDETIWHVNVERIPRLRVPPTLVGVLQARMDSLPAAERAVLQQAALMGRTFWDGAVQAIAPAGTPLSQVRACLDKAQDRELLFRLPSSSFADSSEYRFKHALLRDVAYESILKRDRPALHARAARWLESICGARRNEYLVELAQHYQQAGQMDEAASRWGEAGYQALPVSAFVDAVQFFTRALGLKAGVSAWWRALAEAHFRLGDFPAANAAIQQAQAAAGTDSERAAALALLGEIKCELGEYGEAQTILLEVVPLARASHDRLTMCRGLYALGNIYYRLGKLDEARTALEESLALARALGDVTRELFALNRLGAVWLQIDMAESKRYFLEVYERAVAVGNRERTMVSLNNLSALADEEHDVAAQRQYTGGALQLARELGAQQNIALYLINMASIDMEFGELAAAREKLRESLGMALRLGILPRAVTAMTFFGYLAYAEGRPDRALDLIGLACRQPAWASDDQRVLELTIDDWKMDRETVEAGLARSSLDWDQTVAELLR